MTDDTAGASGATDNGADTGADEACEAASKPCTRTDPDARRRSRLLRWAVLLGVLGLSTLIGVMHQKPELFGTYLRTVPVDALCPFGGVESLWAMVFFGATLKRVALSSFILLAVTIGVALVMGRSFCGQFCPLGTLQEFFARIGGRLFKKRPVVPAVIDGPARYLKYAVLAVFTWWTWIAGELVMRAYDPWAAYHHITSAELLTDFGIGAGVLALAIGGSVVYDRFFCKYLCPMGALLGIFQRLSWMKVVRTPSACIDCGACDKACPVNIEVATAGTVASAECLACGECVNACPAEGALGFASRDGRTMAPTAVTLGTLAAFAAVVGLTTLTGQFEWTKPSLAEAGTAGAAAAEDCGAAASPAAAAPTATVPAFDAAAIKGQNSFNEIAEATGIPLEELLAAFGVAASDADTPLSEAKSTYGFGVGNVRDYVEWRVGVQAAPSGEDCEEAAGSGG